MLRESRLRVVAFVLLVFTSIDLASAQPPDLLRSYRFLPRLSRLHQTGGFAGFNNLFSIHGSYDFVTGFNSEPSPLPVLDPYASFENVDATAVSLTLDQRRMPLEQAVDLESLRGKPIYRGPHGLEVFGFRGTDAQGAPFKMHVATLGRWMFLRGGNDPGCCDFFSYNIRAIGHQVPSADMDDDGIVDDIDLARWREAYAKRVAGSDGAGFLRWQRTVGETPPSLDEFDSMLDVALAAAGGANLANVPEPSALVIVSGMVWVIGLNGRRRY